jgi:DNA-binding XRE family transcriptional regulator
MNTLRQHRKSAHLQQWALAGVTGVSQSRISQIEKRNEIPSLRNARILAAYFDVGIEAMFPDGVQTSPPLGRFVKGYPGKPKGTGEYCPPTPPPPPLVLRCWKCGAVRISYHPTCYACGAGFERREHEQAV